MRRILDSVVGSRGRVATRILQADGRGREIDRCSDVGDGAPRAPAACPQPLPRSRSISLISLISSKW